MVNNLELFVYDDLPSVSSDSTLDPGFYFKLSPMCRSTYENLYSTIYESFLNYEVFNGI